MFQSVREFKFMASAFRKVLLKLVILFVFQRLKSASRLCRAGLHFQSDSSPQNTKSRLVRFETFQLEMLPQSCCTCVRVLVFECWCTSVDVNTTKYVPNHEANRPRRIAICNYRPRNHTDIPIREHQSTNHFRTQT